LKNLSKLFELLETMSAPWFTMMDADLAIAMMKKDSKLNCQVVLTAGGHGLSFTKVVKSWDPKSDAAIDELTTAMKKLSLDDTQPTQQ